MRHALPLGLAVAVTTGRRQPPPPRPREGEGGQRFDGKAPLGPGRDTSKFLSPKCFSHPYLKARSTCFYGNKHSSARSFFDCRGGTAGGVLFSQRGGRHFNVSRLPHPSRHPPGQSGRPRVPGPRLLRRLLDGGLGPRGAGPEQRGGVLHLWADLEGSGGPGDAWRCSGSFSGRAWGRGTLGFFAPKNSLPVCLCCRNSPERKPQHTPFNPGFLWRSGDFPRFQMKCAAAPCHNLHLFILW